jgi:hypothetical protein
MRDILRQVKRAVIDGLCVIRTLTYVYVQNLSGHKRYTVDDYP